MDHTVFTCKPHHACLLFVSVHQMAPCTSNWGSRHPIAAYYSLIDPGGMKGWVGLVGWPIADGLPTLVVTHQLQSLRPNFRPNLTSRRKFGLKPLIHEPSPRPVVAGRGDGCQKTTRVFLAAVLTAVHCIPSMPRILIITSLKLMSAANTFREKNSRC